MPMLEKTLAPENSLLFIIDPTHDFEVPSNTGFPISFTKSCICVGTIAEVDGEATIRLARSFEHSEGEVRFVGTLETPGRKLEVSGVGMEAILAMDVPNTTTQVVIWTNSLSWADLILIQAQ